eukprot:2225603-Prymnesium_polylepis.1
MSEPHTRTDAAPSQIPSYGAARVDRVARVTWTTGSVSRYGLWPMMRREAVTGATAVRAPCGAVAGTKYVSMRGLIGSRRVPST